LEKGPADLEEIFYQFEEWWDLAGEESDEEDFEDDE
jgi:hypothetical protein